MLKKVKIVALALALLLSSISPALAYSHYPGAWYDLPVSWMIDSSIWSSTDGPEDSCPRDLLIHMIVRSHNISRGGINVYFNDTSGTTYADDIAIGASQDIIRGKGSNIFDPFGTSTRAEIATMCTRVMFGAQQPYVSGSVSSFSDIYENWQKQPAEVCRYYGIMVGDPGNTFRPNDPITKGEAAAVVFRLYKCQYNIFLRNGGIIPLAPGGGYWNGNSGNPGLDPLPNGNYNGSGNSGLMPLPNGNGNGNSGLMPLPNGNGNGSGNSGLMPLPNGNNSGNPGLDPLPNGGTTATANLYNLRIDPNQVNPGEHLKVYYELRDNNMPVTVKAMLDSTGVEHDTFDMNAPNTLGMHTITVRAKYGDRILSEQSVTFTVGNNSNSGNTNLMDLPVRTNTTNTNGSGLSGLMDLPNR